MPERASCRTLTPARNDALIAWLSSPENPAVRYLTAVHLRGPLPPGKAKSLRRRVADWEPLKRILALQQADGGFPSHWKTPNAMPTFSALWLMERCGLDAGDEPVAGALAFLSARHAGAGAFSYTTGGSGVLPCYVGSVTRAVIRLAGHGIPAVKSSLQWMVDHQRFDHKETRGGGRKEWSYRAPIHARCWTSVSCYHGVAAVFRALAAVPPRHRSSGVNKRLEEALEYLRIHRVFKKSAGNKALFRHLTQFFISGQHRCHLIDVLEGIADADPGLAREAWVREAIETVDGLADAGRITLAGNYPTMLIDPLRFEPVGRPSRFLTFQWLRVKQKFGLWP